jgi:hypothetical protein
LLELYKLDVLPFGLISRDDTIYVITPPKNLLKALRLKPEVLTCNMENKKELRLNP